MSNRMVAIHAHKFRTDYVNRVDAQRELQRLAASLKHSMRVAAMKSKEGEKQK